MTVDLRSRLLRIVRDERRVNAGESARREHSGGLTYHAAHLPDVVVYAVSTDEVSGVLRFASEHGVPVTPYGAGSSVEGHVVPVRGGISLDLSGLDRPLHIRPADLSATVGAGVLRSALNRHAGGHGLFFPVDPGADASLGGMAATNASGTTTVRYGGMRHQILALQAVLADGTVIRPGSQATKTSAGYDLGGILVGSEGTLAVITELTLRLRGIPEATVALRGVFDELDGACRTAVQLVALGVPLMRAELLDAATVSAINEFKGTTFPVAPSLFLELAGSEASVAADEATVREVAAGNDCVSLQTERDQTARAQLWAARHDAAFAVMATAPGKKPKATDVCVPVSQLPEAIRVAREAIDRRQIRASIAAHAGDGNYHVAFMIDPADRDEVTEAETINREIVDDALSRGGTCSGEHGIGSGKIHYLALEHSDLIPMMRRIKDAFDPAGILNPGKVLPS